MVGWAHGCSGPPDLGPWGAQGSFPCPLRSSHVCTLGWPRPEKLSIVVHNVVKNGRLSSRPPRDPENRARVGPHECNLGPERARKCASQYTMYEIICLPRIVVQGSKFPGCVRLLIKMCICTQKYTTFANFRDKACKQYAFYRAWPDLTRRGPT